MWDISPSADLSLNRDAIVYIFEYALFSMFFGGFWVYWRLGRLQSVL